ncbi:LysR family transcriptional regulator [Peterkaempfera griseoplana]|uniref:LysR family transcriptional regulator n=1 Tax=Peterkaempfera griseoplana TaxID=66896 RepID=UPI00099F0098|nr:LysR family transcriptional regulator [Peterkaempfera griseoplana]
MLELREVECLLTLSEQLHFGRAARELRISQSRVSQTLRHVEQRVGGQLFERTSRQVRLTALGAILVERLRPLYEQMTTAYAEAVAHARGVAGTTRLGFTGAAGGGYAADLVRSVRTHAPECEITLHEVACGDLLGPLRRGEVDILVARLPIDEPDLTVGPLLGEEQRVLAVALDHPAAQLASVSIEEAARDTVFALATTAPAYWRDYHLPLVTPGGRSLRQGQEVQTCQEILSLVAAGRGVAPLAESVARYYAQPDVVFVPIRDLPTTSVALIWRTAEENARIRAVAACAGQPARIPSPGRTAAREPVTTAV